MDDAVRQREALETDLRAAGAKGGLDLVYQPSIELDTGRVTGFEAVIGWRHPVHGDIPPERFLPIRVTQGRTSPRPHMERSLYTFAYFDTTIRRLHV